MIKLRCNIKLSAIVNTQFYCVISNWMS